MSACRRACTSLLLFQQQVYRYFCVGMSARLHVCTYNQQLMNFLSACRRVGVSASFFFKKDKKNPIQYPLRCSSSDFSTKKSTNQSKCYHTQCKPFQMSGIACVKNPTHDCTLIAAPKHPIEISVTVTSLNPQTFPKKLHKPPQVLSHPV